MKSTITFSKLKQLVKESHDDITKKTYGDVEILVYNIKWKDEENRNLPDSVSLMIPYYGYIDDEYKRSQYGDAITDRLSRIYKSTPLDCKWEVRDWGNSLTEDNIKTWRGVPGTKWIWNGEWADPQVEYDGETINANELEDFAWEQYAIECTYSDQRPTEDDFDKRPAKWFKEQLDEYMFGEFGDVNESNADDFIDDTPYTTYTWSINELRDFGHDWETYKNIENSRKDFSTEEEAYRDGLKILKFFDKGHYELEVWDSDNDLCSCAAELHDGELTEY